MMLVLFLIALTSMTAFPRIRDASAKINLASAQAALVSSVARTRATAIQQGRPARLYFIAGRARTNVVNLDGTETTVGQITQVDSLFSVKSVVVSGDSSYVEFDARGVARSGGVGVPMVKVEMTRAKVTKRFCVSAFGRVLRGAELDAGCQL